MSTQEEGQPATSEPGMAGQWQQLNSKIKIGAIVVLLAIVAGGGYWFYSTEKAEQNAEALLHLSRLRPEFDAGRFTVALTGDSLVPLSENRKVKGLRQICSEFSGTPAADIANVMAGNALLHLGKPQEAVSYFEDASGSGALVNKIGSKMGMAACKEYASDWVSAATLYEEAATLASKTGLEDRCYYNAGLCYEKAKNKEKAVETLTKVARQLQNSPLQESAKTVLARLGMAIDW
jgi:tetratricopeptide (TPR) repeat protein